jgi:hypothetical protein
MDDATPGDSAESRPGADLAATADVALQAALRGSAARSLAALLAAACKGGTGV